MRRDLWSATRLLVLPTVALIVVLAFFPGRSALAVRVFALVLCAAAIGLALAALRRALPPTSPLLPSSRRRAPLQVARLGRLENELALGVAGAFDFHVRLRPRLRALAAGLLASRRGISLDAQPDAAREALEDETWQLVRRDRPPPEDRLARGLSRADLTRAVESLERL